MLTVCSRVLVPFDGSELSKKALDIAITLLKQDEKIELDVITVVNTRVEYEGVIDTTLLKEAKVASAKKALNEVGQTLETLSNQSRITVLEGDPAEAILEFIKDNQSDFVVMGSRGLGKIKEMFLGSVSHHVVHKAPCPVVIVK